MKKLVIVLIVVCQLVGLSCKDKGTEPQPSYPPGYQHDMPWPSLADSPWPMYRADPQNTGRSKYSGPLFWSKYLKIPALDMRATPVFGRDSLLFVLTNSPGELKIYKNCQSLIKKIVLGYENHTTPLVDRYNNIYIINSVSINKYNSSGELLWSKIISNSTLSASLIMDKENNLYYIGNDFTINCIDSEGNFKWSVKESRLMKNTYHAPAFSPIGSIIYLQGETVSLIAFDVKNKTVKWTFGQNKLLSAPIVDSYGNIYITPTETEQNKIVLYCLDEAGTVNWKCDLFSRNGETIEEPAIDKNGNLYIGIEDTLYSINYEGKMNWKKSIGFNVIPSSIIVDKNGNIFFTLWRNNNFNKIIAMNVKGDLLWEFEIQDEFLLNPPILGDDGKIIIASYKSYSLHIMW